MLRQHVVAPRDLRDARVCCHVLGDDPRLRFRSRTSPHPPRRYRVQTPGLRTRARFERTFERRNIVHRYVRLDPKSTHHNGFNYRENVGGNYLLSNTRETRGTGTQSVRGAASLALLRLAGKGLSHLGSRSLHDASDFALSAYK